MSRGALLISHLTLDDTGLTTSAWLVTICVYISYIYNLICFYYNYRQIDNLYYFFTKRLGYFSGIENMLIFSGSEKGICGVFFKGVKGKGASSTMSQHAC